MSSYTKWIPFDLACRLRCLQQGALNVGNTRQNIANLLSICLASANGSMTFAKWQLTIKNGTAQPRTALRVYPALVPGFVNPIGLQGSTGSGSSDFLTKQDGTVLTKLDGTSFILG